MSEGKPSGAPTMETKTGTTAVIYARTSSERGERDKELKTARQVEICRELAEKHGLTVIDTLIDDDISGALWPDVPEAYFDKITEAKYNGQRRANFTKVVHYILSGRVQYVIVWNTTRIGRSLARKLSAYIGDTFQANNVKLLSQEKGILDYADFADDIADTIEQRVNRKEINANAKVAETKRKAKHAIGFLRGPPCFGYKSTGKQNVIFNDSERKTVEIIFAEYLAGTGFNDLIRKLRIEKHYNRRNSRKPSDWTNTTLLHVLKNRSYIGKYLDSNGTLQDSPVYKPIVSEETFYSVKSLLSDRSRVSTRSRNRDKAMRYPLSGGLLKCKTCGVVMSGVHNHRSWLTQNGEEHKSTTSYYKCHNPNCTRSPHVTSDDLHNLVRFIWDNRKTHFRFAYDWVSGMASGDFLHDTRAVELQSALDKVNDDIYTYSNDRALIKNAKALANVLSTLDTEAEEIKAKLETLRVQTTRPEPRDDDLRAIAQYLISSILVGRRDTVEVKLTCGVSWVINAKSLGRNSYRYMPLSEAETKALPDLLVAYHRSSHYVPWSDKATDIEQLELDRQEPHLEPTELEHD